MANSNVVQQLADSVGVAHMNARNALAAAQAHGQQLAGMQGQLAQLTQSLSAMREAMGRMQVSSREGNPSIQRVENIPGRRIPFDYLVDIPIGNNVNSVQQGTITISQEGPFVAVARYAAFMSAYSFQVSNPDNPGQPATFKGRSFGRFRPIHSVWDLNDGQPVTQVTQAQAFPGTGSPHIFSPSNLSPFRTMESDFRIVFENAGASFPRSNIEVPSTFWAKSVTDPFDLGALDVFERGEVLQFKVLPLHVNNPPFGNIFGFGAPNPNFPFVDSGWDGVEGISDPDVAAAGTTDPVSRVPSGILTIGFHGYRIVQPAGAGPY